MFTGIVEEMGTIQKIERGSQSAVLSIRCEKVLEGTQIGDSIAVNGVCLTVTSLRSDGYDADVMAETMNRTGTIVKIEKDETAVWYRIEAAPEVLRYIVEKGSITIDGISLTVATVSDTDFQVSIIPHTQANTVLSDRKTGDVVNLETDIIGKYVEKLLQPQKTPEKESKITLEFLAENGF